MKHNRKLEAVEMNPLQADHYVPAIPAPACGEIESLVDQDIRFRAQRSKFLPASLFADPAWDMLLEAYRAHLRQYRVSIKHLSIASRVPATTALRWISALEAQNLISRRPDRLDGRRMYMHLTADGSAVMTAYFLSIMRPDPEEGQRCAR